MWSLLSLALVVYVLLGAMERLAFAQMVHIMPKNILLMHTLLVLMSLALCIVLQLARSQSGAAPISEQLLQLKFVDVIQMAFLDALHSLLALIGATSIPGVVQTMLLQVA